MGSIMLLTNKMYKLIKLHTKSIGIGRFKYNFVGIYEKFTYPISINNERMMTP